MADDTAWPEGFAARVRSVLGAAAHPLPPAPPRAVRFNPLRGDVTDTRDALCAAGFEFASVPWCAHAARLTGGGTLRSLQERPEYASGRFYIQSLSSMVAALAVDPQPGEHVLDLCAAPGSKTSHLAALMRNEGALIANDVSRARIYRLRDNLSRLGADVQTHVGRGEAFARRQPAVFDRVLVDAPCSGEGRFVGGDPTTWSDWSVRKVRRLASLQKSLLHAAIDATRPGGVIVYATCTFSPEENEEVLARAVKRYGDALTFEALPIDVPEAAARPPLESWNDRALPDAIAPARRFVPSPEDGFEGFFIARMRKHA